MNTQLAADGNSGILSLGKISNDELHGQLQNKALEERQLTHHILQIIAEVDRRKLFLPMAHSSLFDYLTKEIGYSAGSAQRRIDSARLLRQVPDLGSKIENGSLNLGQVSQVQRALRLAKKQGSRQLLPSEKKNLLEKLENKTGPETEFILAQEFDFSIESQMKQKIQKDNSVRLELTISQAQMEVLEQAKALLTHTLAGGNLVDVILHLAERYVKQRAGSSGNSTSIIKPRDEVNQIDPATASVAARKGNDDLSPQYSLRSEQKPLLASVKKKVLNRDQGCQFRNLQSGKVCGSTYFAEVDHVHPRFAGGSNEESNLRRLCTAHNKFRYSQGC